MGVVFTVQGPIHTRVGGVGSFSGALQSHGRLGGGGGVGRGGDWVSFRDLSNPQRGGGRGQECSRSSPIIIRRGPECFGALQSIRGRQGRFRELSNPGKETGVFQGLFSAYKRGGRQRCFREL
jgi:hypothetical protein